MIRREFQVSINRLNPMMMLNSSAIVWNAGLDWPQSYSTQMRFRVVAEDGFSYIPGGSFAMGVTSGDTGAADVGGRV